MKVFLSHKMNGLSEEEVMQIRKECIEYLEQRYANEYIEIIDNYHHDDAPVDAGRLWHLGRSIQQMQDADLVYFHESAWNATGCKAELSVCILYDIPYIRIRK